MKKQGGTMTKKDTARADLDENADNVQRRIRAKQLSLQRQGAYHYPDGDGEEKKKVRLFKAKPLNPHKPLIIKMESFTKVDGALGAKADPGDLLIVTDTNGEEEYKLIYIENDEDGYWEHKSGWLDYIPYVTDAAEKAVDGNFSWVSADSGESVDNLEKAVEALLEEKTRTGEIVPDDELVFKATLPEHNQLPIHDPNMFGVSYKPLGVEATPGDLLIFRFSSIIGPLYSLSLCTQDGHWLELLGCFDSASLIMNYVTSELDDEIQWEKIDTNEAIDDDLAALDE
ncbi:MAG: hypothetical protein JAZ15_18410 [Candidatus Thiodiazotropha endolucinida]|nr:hypothetical protein [Candidatus Thiodiazotropha taylori]MCG8053175.1 hypothetical protein [Candidatus Thiodiazotropha taylori]MCW4269173.1 hypothetical protein [Candidatus Thiodiazotropha endolucinida]MCW4314994.1 hypothetical protein [Candidatus Thiodiazotropha taylori]